MAKVNFDKKFRCIGEDFKRNVPIGFCGEVKPLIDFLMVCYPDYDEDHVKNLFKGMSEVLIVEYILVSVGKRIVACK